MKAYLTKWFPLILLAGVLVAGALWPKAKSSAPLTDPYPSAQAINVAPTYPTPAAVMPTAALLGIDLSHIQVTYGNTAHCNTNGDYTGDPLSCFDPNTDSIYLSSFNNMSQAERSVIVAHEYTHHVWFKMSVAEQNALVPSIQAVYAAHAYELNNRLAGYTLTGVERTDELHSYECTEMADSELPADLRAHCAQYVPNRNALPSLY